MKENILNCIKKLYEITDQDHNLYVDELQYDTSLFNSGFMDSMSLVILISMLEKSFEVKINEKDIFPGNFETIEKIELLLKKYII
jgi:acyl carrier protein